MNDDDSGPVTRLLRRLSSGDVAAQDELFPLVYQEIHRIAHQQLRRERTNHTMQTTDLAHEMYLELFEKRERSWDNRVHFARHAATAMRHALIDHARRRRTAKHGGSVTHEPLDELVASFERDHFDLLDLNEALEQLGEAHADLVPYVDLRFFSGLTEEEIARVLGRPLRSLQREWEFARAWLQRRLREGNGHGE